MYPSTRGHGGYKFALMTDCGSKEQWGIMKEKDQFGFIFRDIKGITINFLDKVNITNEYYQIK